MISRICMILVNPANLVILSEQGMVNVETSK